MYILILESSERNFLLASLMRTHEAIHEKHQETNDPGLLEAEQMASSILHKIVRLTEVKEWQSPKTHSRRE